VEPAVIAVRIRGACRRVMAVLATGLRATRIIAGNPGVPVLLRALLVAGMLPVPGPFDEVALTVALAWLFAFHRAELRDAIAQARNQEEKQDGTQG
jgi:hypothetical protein